MLRFHNIRRGPNSVNRLWPALLGAYTLLKLWLVADVELGKDEAVYWYWGQHLDAFYALLPLAVFKLTHALYPHQEWFLRLPSALLGAFSTALVYRLCRMQGLAERLALWAAAAFAFSHWTWHTSSYLHPDGFLVPCWLLALCMARQAAATNALRPYIYMGLAAGLAVLCKYSGAFLVVGLGLWIALDQRGKKRWHLLAAFLLPAVAVAAPLTYAQFSTDFYLPQTLSTLSRIDDLGHPLARLLFFAVSPLFFISPFLLFLLYAGLVRAAKQRDLLALLPALCTIGAFFVFRARPRSDQRQLAPAGSAEPVADSIRCTPQTLAARRPRRHRAAASARHRPRTEIPRPLQRPRRAQRAGQKLCWLGVAGRPRPRAFLLVERTALRVQWLAPLRRRRRGGYSTAAAAEYAVQHTVCTGVLRTGQTGVLHG